MQNINVKIQPLLSHIADELFTNINFYDTFSQEWNVYAQKLAVEDPIFEKPEVKAYLMSGSMAKYNPALVQINTYAVYTVVFCPHGNYVVGPVLLPTDIICSNQLDIYPSEQNFADYLQPVSLTTYFNHIFLLYNLFHEEQMNLEAYASQEQFTSKLFRQIRENVTHLAFNNKEFQHKHNPFDNELRDLKAIEEGRLDQFEQLWRDNYVSENLSVLSRNPARNAKYLTIMAITLASRAAIRGGVLPEIALSLCDTYIRQIDELLDLSQLESIARDAWISFAYLVSETHTSKAGEKLPKGNPIINQCKDYIFQHLHEKITVSQVADALHLNATYLTNLFKRHEGISLYQFILNEKVNLVKNLLTYSNYSYIDIANYLGFTSQSHLIRIFKSTTGMTPKYFRDTYGKKEQF